MEALGTLREDRAPRGSGKVDLIFRGPRHRLRPPSSQGCPDILISPPPTHRHSRLLDGGPSGERQGRDLTGHMATGPNISLPPGLRPM